MSDLNNLLDSMGISPESLNTTELPDPPENVDEPTQPLQRLDEQDYNDILSQFPNVNTVESTVATVPEEHHDATEEALVRNDVENAAEPAPQEEGNHLLTPNSPSLLVEEDTSRFSGAEWFKQVQEAKVILAGLGGIGSHTAFNLARLRPKRIILYDDDTVDFSNLSGQFYGYDDVGFHKASTLERKLQAYAPAPRIYAINEKFDENCDAGDIMICGFDNMIARKAFFKVWKKHVEKYDDERRKKCLFIDGRLSMTVLQVLCITGDDRYNISRYRNQFLFDDYDADATVCSMKQTTYLASMIGAVITNLFTNFIANQLDPVIPYSLPFFTEYDAQLMTFKKEN